MIVKKLHLATGSEVLPPPLTYTTTSNFYSNGHDLMSDEQPLQVIKSFLTSGSN